MNVNFYAQRFVGKVLDVNNLPATVEGTGEATQISGRFVITDYSGGGDQVGVFYLMPEDAHNEFYAAMETDPNFADREFDFPMYTVGVADLFEQTTDDMWDEIEVQHLQSQFDLPSAEHPLGPHTGHITNMEDNTRTGADILNTPSETPRFDVPFEETEEAPAEGEFTDEEYASIPQEFNNKLGQMIRQMHEAGTPIEEIMRHTKEIIEAYINSNRRTAYTEGANWYHGDGANWCEDCVKAGKAPQNAQFTGPIAEDRQIECAGCKQQEGILNREFGRDLVEKMPQNPKLPGIGTIPIDLDVVRETPSRGSDPYDRKRDWHGSSTDRLSIPDEHLGW